MARVSWASFDHDPNSTACRIVRSGAANSDCRDNDLLRVVPAAQRAPYPRHVEVWLISATIGSAQQAYRPRCWADNCCLTRPWFLETASSGEAHYRKFGWSLLTTLLIGGPHDGLDAESATRHTSPVWRSRVSHEARGLLAALACSCVATTSSSRAARRRMVVCPDPADRWRVVFVAGPSVQVDS